MLVPLPRLSAAEHLVFAWAVLGVLGVLYEALARLVPRALAAWGSELEPAQLGFLALWVPALVWTEGIRGFQRRFNPRVIARALAAAREPTALRVLLAPCFAMALFGATRRRLLGAWGLVAILTVVILVVRTLPEPWRGIVDLGVVGGIGWGAIDLLRRYVLALAGRGETVDAGVA